ncbi:MAG TPA: hypothetical protein DIW30_00575 [Bacteroidales bacterium]|nr:hypothetical protein [Bacteroidales bacterium]
MRIGNAGSTLSLCLYINGNYGQVFLFCQHCALPDARKSCARHIFREDIMKKTFYVTLAAIGMLAVGCGPQNPPEQKSDGKDTTVVNPPDTTIVTPPDTIPEEPKVSFPSEGYLPAKFKVADGKYVYFAKGNLQFNAAQGEHACADSTTQKGTWRFAENQYERIMNLYDGTWKEEVSETYDGWIDCFAWGTSGWNSGAKCYQPWSVSENKDDFSSASYPESDLTGDLAFADWGVYNAISNGGNLPSQWRTLTKPEWQYLFRNTHWTLIRVAVAEDNEVGGLMFMPDGFTLPEGLELTEIGTGDFVKNDTTDMKKCFPINDYSLEEFRLLEAKGCMMLPFVYTETNKNYMNGTYWTASADGASWAHDFHTSIRLPYEDTLFGFSSEGYTLVNFNDANCCDRHRQLVIRLAVDARE